MQAYTIKGNQLQPFKEKPTKSFISTDSRAFPLVVRKIKCPNYFILKPGKDGFKKVPNGRFKGWKEGDLNKFNLKNWKWKRDSRGNKVPEWNDYYQPVVSASYALEHIYDPSNWVCKNQCRGKCLEGHGAGAWRGVKRLNG